ncbi:MAG TPA: hypothetical protein ENN31_01400 [Candidatus Vogelbacteria bacterium]|nr:hypothetical protein [Candidatus Vogelbacteria bacterium]
MKKTYLYLLVFILSLPTLVMAQDGGQTLSTMINNTLSIIFTPLVALLIGLGLLVFLWGLVRYIGSADNEEGQKNARNIMIYGIIGLFVMVTVWGLVNVVVKTFFSGDMETPDPMQLFPS